jgi:hypothetical protein
MGDSYDDSEVPPISETYCKEHPGLWPHECGCANKKQDKCDHNFKFWGECTECGLRE